MNTTLHITIDRATKIAAQKLAKELGLDLSTIVRASLKTFVQTESFSVEKTNRMTPYLEKIIEKSEKEYSEGKFYGPFKTAEESIRFLNSKRWK